MAYFSDGQPVTREMGKMGKSLKNGVSPDDMYDEYGADTLRLYEMATGPMDTSRPWETRDGLDQDDDGDIDASSLLYGQHELDGVDGVKRYLLASRQDQFARAIVHKMTTFALGRPLTFGDRSSVDRLTAELRKEGDGLRTQLSWLCNVRKMPLTTRMRYKTQILE